MVGSVSVPLPLSVSRLLPPPPLMLPLTDEPPYRRKVSLPPANTRLPITLPLLVKSSVLLPVAPITLPGAWITPVSLLTT